MIIEVTPKVKLDVPEDENFYLLTTYTYREPAEAIRFAYGCILSARTRKENLKITKEDELAELEADYELGGNDYVLYCVYKHYVASFPWEIPYNHTHNLGKLKDKLPEDLKERVFKL